MFLTKSCQDPVDNRESSDFIMNINTTSGTLPENKIAFFGQIWNSMKFPEKKEQKCS